MQTHSELEEQAKDLQTDYYRRFFDDLRILVSVFWALVLRDEVSNSKSVKSYVEMRSGSFCGQDYFFRSSDPTIPRNRFVRGN